MSTAFSTVPRTPSTANAYASLSAPARLPTPGPRPWNPSPMPVPPARGSGVLPAGSMIAKPGSVPNAVPMRPLPTIAAPPPPPLPRTTAERMIIARERIRVAAETGQRIRSYEVALDVDLSEFHFARQFRAAFGRSPHVYYDEIRAERARVLLGEGLSEGDVARRIGFRRPAELRALLAKRVAATAPAPAAE